MAANFAVEKRPRQTSSTTDYGPGSAMVGDPEAVPPHVNVTQIMAAPQDQLDQKESQAHPENLDAVVIEAKQAKEDPKWQRQK